MVRSVLAAARQPHRPPFWVFGDAGGVQVWAVDGDPRVLASVLIGAGSPIVLINRVLADTAAEHGLLSWAFTVIAAGAEGFYVWTA